jgi:hypothetical protein
LTGVVGQFFRELGLTSVGAVLVARCVACAREPVGSGRGSMRGVAGG